MSATSKPSPPRFQDIFFTSRDGLRLHARHYPAPATSLAPVLCLPGLSRTTRDFHALATALSSDPEKPREVYVLDYRGRGQSDWDEDWKNYSVLVEAQDVIDFCTLRGLHAVSLVGTSRGGIIAMIIGGMQPGLMHCVVLNDIGPVLEADGLMRISGYIGETRAPDTWEKAGELIKRANEDHFTGIDDAEWIEIARQIFNEKDGRPAPGYDPALKRAISAFDGEFPKLWPQFEALYNMPMLVIRGENSDLLSDETVDEMCRRHPDCRAKTVMNQGHAPYLRDTQSQGWIKQFLTETERRLS